MQGSACGEASELTVRDLGHAIIQFASATSAAEDKAQQAEPTVSEINREWKAKGLRGGGGGGGVGAPFLDPSLPFRDHVKGTRDGPTGEVGGGGGGS